MKRSKLPVDLAKNASKLHKRVGELLVSEDSLYKFYEIRQEYMVSKVNSKYSSNRERFDWVILGLNIVIEIMGEFHEKAIKIGGISIEEAHRNLKRRQKLDQDKKEAAEAAGWTYVVVNYREKNIDLETLDKKIAKAIGSISEIAQKPTKSYKQKIPIKKNHTWPNKKIPNKPFEGNKK
jgi:hypothetical protein